MILIAVYCCRTLTHYIVADDYEHNSKDFHGHDHEDLVGHSSEDLVGHNSREIVIQQPSKKSGPHIRTSADGVVRCGDRVVVRGKNRGKELDRMSRGGRITLVVPPGRTRPESAVLAAKFATECAVTVRSHMPILPR